MDEFEFASISELELRMSAEDILAYCGKESTSKAVEDTISFMRQSIYKCVDDTNDWLGKKQRREEREEMKAAEEAETFREAEEEKAAEKRSERMTEIVPDDYEQNDDLVFGFALMQLILGRMDKVGISKHVNLVSVAHADIENKVEIRAGDSKSCIDDGKVIMTTSDGYESQEMIFELMNPNSLDLIIDRIFLDS